jgi:hypothetical protein
LGKYSLESLLFPSKSEVDFDSLSEYSLFKWKSMRAVYSDYCRICQENSFKDDTLKDYRLIKRVSR